MEETIQILARWLHVAAAVGAVGATLAMRFVVLPAAAEAPDGAAILPHLLPRLKRLVHTCIGLLLVTGFYNYLAVSSPAAREAVEQGKQAIQRYHMVMGIKILVSFGLFAAAIMLLMPSFVAPEKRKGWLTMNAALGLAVLLLGAYLRRLWAMP